MGCGLAAGKKVTTQLRTPAEVCLSSQSVLVFVFVRFAMDNNYYGRSSDLRELLDEEQVVDSDIYECLVEEQQLENDESYIDAEVVPAIA